MIPKHELAIAAGLMEGEGCIRINAITKRNKGALIVCMSNTNKQIVDWMQNRWPGYCKAVTGMTGNRKPAWTWAIASNKALKFLIGIEPFVITDRMRERIETAFRWQRIKWKHWRDRTESDYEESFNCWHWMAELNTRGTNGAANRNQHPNSKQHRKGE